MMPLRMNALIARGGRTDTRSSRRSSSCPSCKCSGYPARPSLAPHAHVAQSLTDHLVLRVVASLHPSTPPHTRLTECVTLRTRMQILFGVLAGGLFFQELDDFSRVQVTHVSGREPASSHFTSATSCAFHPASRQQRC
jgi:hypothetical protein